MRPCCYLPSLLVILVTGTSGALAQDMRRVEEPRVPPICVVLQARVAAVDGVLPAGADNVLDTDRIQQALDRCAAGTRRLSCRPMTTGRPYLSGPLTLRSGVTLLIAANTSLAASSNPRLYDINPGSCGILGERGQGCRPLLSGNDISASGIMGEGSIDGRGGARISGETATWWQLAMRAKLLDQYQKVPGLIELRHVHDFTLYRITLRDSAAHYMSSSTTRTVLPPGCEDHRAPGPRAIPTASSMFQSAASPSRIFHNHVGDDNVAISSRVGAPASHISILDNHFYTGHGMSIGSGTAGGVSHVMVRNLTIDGAMNGIRIKSDASRGGLVQDIRYENVCIRNVTNPIVLTPHYTDFPGELIPQYRDITLRNVHILTAGDYVLAGLDTQHNLGVTLDNVFADGVNPAQVVAQYADITLGAALGNLEPQGPNVTLGHAPESRPGLPLPCQTRFVAFPVLNAAPRAEVEILR